MSARLPELSPPHGARLQDVIAGSPGIALKLKRCGVFVLKLALGAFFCCGMYGLVGPLGFIGAVLAVGLSLSPDAAQRAQGVVAG